MEIEYKIEIFPLPCKDCMEFHYVVMRWQPPTGKRSGFWHNSGISGHEKSVELAFSKVYERFKIYLNDERKLVND